MDELVDALVSLHPLSIERMEEEIMRPILGAPHQVTIGDEVPPQPRRDRRERRIP